jgi:hypothetical protein
MEKEGGFKGLTNRELIEEIRMAVGEMRDAAILEMRKRAFVQGLADRIAGSPMLARDDDGDDEYWADEYALGYDPRNEMDMNRPEFREKCAADVIELTALTGSVIPDVFPYNRCEFPAGAPAKPTMSFEQFQATGNDVDNVNFITGFDGVKPGRVYHSGLYIEKEPDGRFFLCIANADWLVTADKLPELEKHLYEFGISEGYFE